MKRCPCGQLTTSQDSASPLCILQHLPCPLSGVQVGLGEGPWPWLGERCQVLCPEGRGLQSSLIFPPPAAPLHSCHRRLLLQRNAQPWIHPSASCVPSSLLLRHHRHPVLVPRLLQGGPILLWPDGLLEPAALDMVVTIFCREVALTYRIERNCSSCEQASSVAGLSVSPASYARGHDNKGLVLGLPSVAVFPPPQGNPRPSATCQSCREASHGERGRMGEGSVPADHTD